MASDPHYTLDCDKPVRDDRLALLDDFTQKFFAADGRTEVINEPARQYSLQIASSAKGRSTAARHSVGPTFGETRLRCSFRTLIIQGTRAGSCPSR